MDFLEKTATALSEISVNCATWSAAEIAKLDQATASMRDAQTACAYSLKSAPSRSDLFVSTAATFNKMRKSRTAKPAVPTGIVIVGAPVMPAFTVPSNPYAAGYYSQIKALVRQYKSLRGDLERSGVSDRAKYTGGVISDYDRSILQAARDRRQSILNQISSIPVPEGCGSMHDSAYDAVFNGISAIDDLLNCNWDAFHQKSNNGLAKKAYSDFGLGG